MESSQSKSKQGLENNKEQKHSSIEKKNQRYENSFKKIMVKYEERGSSKDLKAVIANPLKRQITEEAKPANDQKKNQNQHKTSDIQRESKGKVTLPPIPKLQQSKNSSPNISEIKKASQKNISPLFTSKQNSVVKRFDSPSKNHSNIKSQNERKKDTPLTKVIIRDPNFVKLPILQGFLLQGTINRIRVDTNQAHNNYQFIISENKEQILTAVPQSFVINSIYHIKQDGKDIAILESNYMGSKFELKKIGQQNPMCTIQFLNNSQCDEVRFLKVHLSKQNVTLQSRIPIYDHVKKSYTMSFNDRATMSSLKNVILVEPPYLQQNILLLGKTDKNKFNLDLTNPLSPLQAFAVAISSFDPKLYCK